MILSKQKQNFVLDKSIEAINNAYDYELDTSVYSKTFKLKYLLERKSGTGYKETYKVSLYFYEKKLSRVTLYREEGHVEIDVDGHAKKFELISNIMFDKVKQIDDDKFKKIFPEYDVMEERNDLLEELLGSKDEPTEEPIIDTKPSTTTIEKKRKKYWLF